MHTCSKRGTNALRKAGGQTKRTIIDVVSDVSLLCALPGEKDAHPPEENMLLYKRFCFCACACVKCFPLPLRGLITMR